MFVASYLDANEELGQPIGHVAVLAHAGRRMRFVQTQKREIARVEQVGHGIPVFLDQRCFAETVLRVGHRRPQAAVARRSQLFSDRA